ncbi:MAG: transcription termination/antitermination NusG family protein [Thermoguttaceae bacterium]
MLIVREEVSADPEDVLAGDWSADAASPWWVLYTKSRQEKPVARHILAHGVPFYVPLVEKAIAYRGRRLVSHVPLLSGHAFVYDSREARVRALTSNRVSRVLAVDDPQRLRNDLRRIRRWTESGAALSPESRRRQRVRVCHAARAGREGPVLKRAGPNPEVGY